MRVVILSWRDLANPSAGGAEVLVNNLLEGLRERGHDVALVCGGPVSPHHYEVVDAGGTYSQYLKGPIICLRRFRDSDVLIDAENGLPFFSPLWRRRPSICLVNHLHTDQWQHRFPRAVAAVCREVERRIMPFVYRKCQFVAISTSTARSLADIGIDPGKIEVIECGVDVPAGALPEKSPEPLFLSLNRLVPHKRIELLLEAWEMAGAAIGGRLVVAGDGPELESIRAKASLIPRVDVLGRVSDQQKRELLAGAWAVLSAAQHEGWGLSMLEAAAVATPAIAVDAPGIRDAVVHGRTGILVAAENDAELPANFAKAMVEFVNDAETRRSMGQAGQARARKFNWNRFVDRWETVLTDVVASRPAPAQRRRHRSRGTTSEIGRSLRLFRGFQTQYEDPEGFYSLLAEDTAELVNEFHPLSDSRVVDVGGGSGYFARAFRDAGAQSTFVEPFWESLTDAGKALGFGILGDGLSLPFADGSLDVSHSSNVIEHVRDPKKFLDEMVRVVRPGGLVFLAFTNWFSPFGGHETSPWHYLGGERAALRYERRHGYPPKNRFGSSLFRLDISDVLAWTKRRGDADVIDSFPRYYPRWTKPLVSIPWLRELATWNLVVVLRKR